jgi:predicted enzyme related to lactoylglutathione lyase
MGRIVHFEIHVNDMERAKAFYGEVFGWSFQDWSDYALMQRQSAPPETHQALNAFACTIGVGNYDLTEAKIIENGGKLAMPKFALPGMAWQGYYIDPEGNTFGIHQPDVNAK